MSLGQYYVVRIPKKDVERLEPELSSLVQADAVSPLDHDLLAEIGGALETEQIAGEGGEVWCLLTLPQLARFRTLLQQLQALAGAEVSGACLMALKAIGRATLLAEAFAEG